MKIDQSVNNFSINPDNYVLLVEESEGEKVLKAEEKGVWTWLKANIFCKSSYSLPRIICEINKMPKIDNALEVALQQKFNRYKARHMESDETFMTNVWKKFIAENLRPYIPHFAPGGAEPATRDQRLHEIITTAYENDEVMFDSSEGCSINSLKNTCLITYIRESVKSFKKHHPGSSEEEQNQVCDILKTALSPEIGPERQYHRYGDYDLSEGNKIEEIARDIFRNSPTYT
jgi:hypothetical protein